MIRVIVFQGIITVLTALTFLLMEYQKIESSVFGGILSILNTLLLARSINQAGTAALEQNISGGTLVIFKSLIFRMALVLLGFYVGIVQFSLDALQMLAAFALAQLGYAFNKTKTIY